MRNTPEQIHVLGYSTPEAAQPSTRMILSGALHAAVGVAMLMLVSTLILPMLRSTLFSGATLRAVLADLLVLVLPLAELAVGFCCIGRVSAARICTGRLLSGVLLLAYSVGVMIGIVAIVTDNYSAEWGGLQALAGLVLGVPCLLLGILSLIALIRFAHLAREPG